jgi:hypothetical protein
MTLRTWAYEDPDDEALVAAIERRRRCHQIGADRRRLPMRFWQPLAQSSNKPGANRS